MGAFVLVHHDSYHDSVWLMRLSDLLKRLPGIEDAAVVMGTPANRELLAAQAYGGPELASATSNDLVIAARGSADATAIEAEAKRLLTVERPRSEDEVRPTSLAAAFRAHPEARLALISVPGEYAVREARRALSLDRHVMVFSDNVSLDDEVALKRMAVASGLLMMGPDCGTAIIDGRPLGLANAVRRGSIGVVGAAGTGIQEVTSVIHRLGGGISQAIGTGGRDLSDRVGGAMTLFGIAALAADPATEIIVVISKPPSPAVADKVVAALRGTRKPGVVHYVGAAPGIDHGPGRISFADSLANAGERACRLAGLAIDAAAAIPDAELAEALAARLVPGSRLRALFCGGTTGQEALAVLGRERIDVRSNLHKQGELRVDGLEPMRGHVLLDLGDDVFTRGRPHPMIEPALRNERLATEMGDPDVGLLLFDCVLGYGAHPDPAGLLAEGVESARATAKSRGRELVAIASVTGTPDDPQDSNAQARRLASAGVSVQPSNHAAAALAAAVLRRIG